MVGTTCHFHARGQMQPSWITCHFTCRVKVIEFKSESQTHKIDLHSSSYYVLEYLARSTQHASFQWMNRAHSLKINRAILQEEKQFSKEKESRQLLVVASKSGSLRHQQFLYQRGSPVSRTITPWSLFHHSHVVPAYNSKHKSTAAFTPQLTYNREIQCLPLSISCQHLKHQQLLLQQRERETKRMNQSQR